MKATVIAEGAERTFVLVFETGDEVIDEITRLCPRSAPDRRTLSSASARSAKLTVGYFNWETKTYDHIAIAEQVEVLSLAGDIAEHRGQAAIHAHIVVGKARRLRPWWPPGGGRGSSHLGARPVRGTGTPAQAI